MFDNLDIDAGNQVIVDKVSSGDPFYVARLAGPAGDICMQYEQRINPDQSCVDELVSNDGLYFENLSQLKQILDNYISAIASADIMACFPKICQQAQEHFVHKHEDMQVIHNRALEPFYVDNNRWTTKLSNHRVLIVSPLVNTIQQQIDNKNLPSGLWHDDQQFITYKAYNTQAGNHVHNNCLETLQYMKDDIKQIEFDIAVLGCGGYGLMLCDFIKNEMNRSAIYVGGGLQLMFGVLGNRWVNNSLLKIKLNNFDKFIRPLENDRIKNYQSIESGCYW